MNSMLFMAAVIIALSACAWALSLNRRLREIEQNLAALLRHFSIDPAVIGPPSDRVRQIAMDPARRIEAMRLYRLESGADVRVAKTAIDALMDS